MMECALCTKAVNAKLIFNYWSEEEEEYGKK